MRLNIKTRVSVALADHGEGFIGHLNEKFFNKRSELTSKLIGDDFSIGFVEKSLIDFSRMVREKLPYSHSDFRGEHHLFDSEDEAKRLLTKDLAAGARRYTFYRFDGTTKSYYQIRNGKEHQIR